MKKRRNEEQIRNPQRPDYVIAPDGLIPNSVIRAKIKGLSNSPTLPNRPSQAPVNQLSLRRTSEERKPTQQTPETTSSASTFFWESDPDDERIGPRAKEIVEDTPSGSTKADVVQTLEDPGSYEFNASDVLQILTEETGTHEGLESKPNWTKANEEEEEDSRNPEVLGVDEGLNLENELNDSQGFGVGMDLNPKEDENVDHCGFSNGSHSGYLPSTYNSVKEVDPWRISSDGEAGSVARNEGYLPPDIDLSDAHVTMKHINGSDDVERSDTVSDTPSCVTLRNDEEVEVEDVDKLCSAIVGMDELREGEEQWNWKTASVLSIGLETVSPRDGKPVERRSGESMGEPDNLDANRDQLTYEVTKKKKRQLQPRLVSKTMVSSADKNLQMAGYTTHYHTIEIPSTDRCGGRRLLPNNPAMYRMYKKRDEMLNSVGRISY